VSEQVGGGRCWGMRGCGVREDGNVWGAGGGVVWSVGEGWGVGGKKEGVG